MQDTKRIGQIEKIQMLLALGKSTNQHEAESAMAKAQELMMRYKLTQTEVSAHTPLEENPMHRMSFIVNRKRRTMQDTYVLWALGSFYGIQSVYVNLSNSIKYTFLGRKSDVEVAEYLYHFITRFFDNQWDNYCRENPVQGAGRRKDQKSFYHGCYEGIKQVLAANRKRVVTEMGLVPVDDSKAVQQYVHEQFPRLRSSVHEVRLHSASAREAGVAAGRTFSHTRGVTGGPSRRMIGG